MDIALGCLLGYELLARFIGYLTGRRVVLHLLLKMLEHLLLLINACSSLCAVTMLSLLLILRLQNM